MSYYTPGTYTLSEVTITTHENKKISILYIIDTISIIEDIYTNFLHGSLVFGDANDLQQIAPLIGEETIKLIYKTTDTTPEITREFRVYRVETSDDKYKDRISHTLYFASKEAFVDSNVIISKSYKSKSIKFIISDAFKLLESSKNLNITDLSGLYHIISPSWSPLQLINYCTSIAKPKNYFGSMILFYENFEGFNFKHLEELLIQPIVGSWKTSNAKNKDKSNPQEEIHHQNNIIKYTIIKNSVDTLKSMSEGLYNNAVISYDHITKSYKTFGYDYNKDFSKSQHLAGFKLNSSNFNLNNNSQRLTYNPTTSFRYDSPYVKSKLGSINLSEQREQIIPSRTSLLSQISAKQIELEVAGDTRLLAGKTIQIKIPNVTAIDSLKIESHRYNNKKVLITSITNIFTQQSHTMILHVADDSYINELKSTIEFDKATINV